MSQLKFTQTAYLGKKGVLPPPDSDGYYTVIVGALNCYNSAGEYYVGQDVVEVFGQSSLFQDRVKNGALYSEVGHPVREPGSSFTDYSTRVMTIRETNICGHFSEVWLDLNYGQKNKHLGNPELIAIFAKVKPCGVHAQVLETSLTTPQQNTAFSIRGVTDNKQRNNRVERRLTNVITFDHVCRPGIRIADKANVPGLESDSSYVVELQEASIVASSLTKCFTSGLGNLAQEAGIGIRDEILQTMRQMETASVVKRLPSW